MDHDFTYNPEYRDATLPSRLTERLYLSGDYAANNHELLRTLGVTAVVNLTPDSDGTAEAGFKTLHLMIEDATALDPTTVARFIEQMEAWDEAGETVLIHCHAGISRTSAFTIAWLMHVLGANAQSDLRTLWSKCEDIVGFVRPIIMPHYLLKRAVLQHFEGIAA